MPANKLLAVFLPILAIITFTIVYTFFIKKPLTKKLKQLSFLVFIVGFSVLIIVSTTLL